VVDAFTKLGISGVSVVRPGSSNPPRYSDNSGTYSMEIETGVNGVSIELVFSKTNYFNGALTDEASIYGGGTTDAGELKLTPTVGTITGRIIDGASFRGLSGAIVGVQGNNRLTTVSGVGGTYVIENVPVLNDYTIEASLNGYTSDTGTAELAPGKSSIVDIYITPQTGTISGIVRNYADQLGLTGASVRVQGDATTQQNTTDGGYYEMANVSANPDGLPVTVTLTGFEPMTITSAAVKGGSSITLDFDLTPTTGTIIGTVKDTRSKLGLSGVLVKAPGLGVSQTYTDSSGSYQMLKVPANAADGISIEVSKANYQTDTVTTLGLTGGKVITQNFQISQVVGSIAGTVIDNDTNLGISGAAVVISGSTLPTVYTGSSGAYLITEVPMNDDGVTLRVSINDYGTQSVTTEAILGGVQLDVPDIKIDSLYGTIAGSVKDAATQIGITGVIIRIPGTTRTTLSKDGGYYELTGVPETTDDVSLEAVITGYEIKKETVTQEIQSGTIVTKDILMTSLYGSIVGTIKNSKTNIGVSGAQVRVSGLSKSTFTDSSGYYELDNVPSNSEGVVLIASKVNYKIFQSAKIGVTGGQQSTGDFQITPSVGTIAGTVTNNNTGLAIVDAKIRIKDTTLNTSTDSNGYYIISEIPEKDGQYKIECSFTNFTSQISDAPVIPATFEGGTSFTLNFALAPSTGYLTGIVTDAVTGLGLTGIEISTNNETVKKITTSAGGYYQFTNYPLDLGVKVSLNALNYRYQGTSMEITIASSGETQDFDLTPAYGTVMGQVSDSKNYPKEDAVVTIVNYNLKATTDSNGYYVISDMPLGKNIGTVKAVLAGYSTETDNTLAATKLLVTNINESLDFSLTRLTGVVTGYCVDGSTGSTISSCYVVLSNDEWFFSSTTGTDGKFTFDDVPAGEAGEGFSLIAAKGTQYAMTDDDKDRTFNIQEGVTHEVQLELYSNFAAALRVFGKIHIRDSAGAGIPTAANLTTAGIVDADHVPAGVIVRLAGTGYSTVADEEGRFMLYLDDAISDAGLDDVLTIALEAVIIDGLGVGTNYVTMEFFTVNTDSKECYINDNGTNSPPPGIVQPTGPLNHPGGIMIHEADVTNWPPGMTP
jgi:hypothetical protein